MTPKSGDSSKWIAIVLSKKEWFVVASLIQRGLDTETDIYLPVMPPKLAEDGEKVLKKIDAELEGE